MRRHKLVIGLAAGLVAVSVPAGVHAAPDDGSPFTSSSGEFTIVFPSEPEDMSELMPSGPGTGEFEMFASFEGDTLFMAGRLESFFPVDAEEADLELLVEQFVMGLGGGEVTHSALIEHRGFIGFEISAVTDEVTGSPSSLFGRFYFTRTVGYLSFVMGERPSISIKDPDVAAFVDSFDFVKEAF